MKKKILIIALLGAASMPLMGKFGDIFLTPYKIGKAAGQYATKYGLPVAKFVTMPRRALRQEYLWVKAREIKYPWDVNFRLRAKAIETIMPSVKKFLKRVDTYCDMHEEGRRRMFNDINKKLPPFWNASQAVHTAVKKYCKKRRKFYY